ncbi:MAG: pyruvate kinase, partial [Alphaproteobacteria bacterium]|nr:pyruvate kinase [Alphaproteobacteria bacterium]
MTTTKHQRKTEILCTLGPSSMNDRVIARLEDLGVNLFRINLSHTTLEDLPAVIEYIQSRSEVPICLDTEGAQVRTGTLGRTKLQLRENQTIKLVGQSDTTRKRRLRLYPDWVLDHLEVGDLISVDFNDVLVQVSEKSAKRIKVRVLNGGKVRSNKAVTLHGELSLPPLTEKDRAALRIGAERGLRHIALSFANAPEDVDEIRDAFGREAFVISKIECRAGLANLEAIARRSDAILIDRGDLSREVAIEQIP